jgi:hypothetical protein
MRIQPHLNSSRIQSRIDPHDPCNAPDATDEMQPIKQRSTLLAKAARKAPVTSLSRCTIPETPKSYPLHQVVIAAHNQRRANAI